MLSRIALSALLASAALLVACDRETAEEVEHREALAPLVHAHLSITADHRRRVSEEAFGERSWADVFEYFSVARSDQEEVLRDMRGVVPTERYSCYSNLLRSSIDREVELYRLNERLFRQLFDISTTQTRLEREIERAERARTRATLQER